MCCIVRDVAVCCKIQSFAGVLQRVLTCVVVCCSVLQCVAMCCIVQGVQCVVTYRVSQACCSVWPCVAVCCGVLQCVAVFWPMCCSASQCVALCRSVLLVCCGVSQCVVLCCGVLRQFYRSVAGVLQVCCSDHGCEKTTPQYVSQCVANVSQCAAGCCRCVAVCCSVL